MRQIVHFLRKEEKGQAMIEFALVLPLLVFMILFCLDVAWYCTNLFSLDRYAEKMMSCIPSPKDSPAMDWGSNESVRFPGWRRTIEEGAPSWLTVEEKLNFDDDFYAGWREYDWTHGEEYGQYSYFSAERSFLPAVKALNDPIIKFENIDYEVQGGWLLNISGLKMPSENSVKTDGKGRGIEHPRNLYFYCDTDLQISYEFRPISFVGQLLWCNEDRNICKIEVDMRMLYPAGSIINSY